jgi:sugar-phosphatase
MKRLQVAGIPIPAKMITADDVVNGKPDPEPYLKGAELLGFTGSECLVFEDAPSGIRSAQAAGAMAIAVATTYRPEELTLATTIIPSLAVVRSTGDGSGLVQLEVESGAAKGSV